MNICILGSGTAFPQEHRSPTGIWVSTPETSLLVDCGAGTSQRFVRAGGDLQTLDGILLSHAHLDHLGDLPSLLFALSLPDLEREADLEILHSHRLTPFLDELRAPFGRWMSPEHFRLRWTPIEPGQTSKIGSLAVGTFPVEHHETSIGFVLEGSDGATVTIPADTAPCEALVVASGRADCLIIECSAADDTPRVGHMTPQAVVTLLNKAKPRAAVITHQYPDAEAAHVVDQIRAGAQCPVLEAVDGLRLTVQSTGNAPLIPAERAAPAPGFFETFTATEIHTLMEADLASLDTERMIERKYRGGAGEEAPRAPRVAPKSRRRLWSEGDLSRVRPNRRQKDLVNRVRSGISLPELNLRHSHSEDAKKRLAATVQTWFESGVREALVITGKGKRSEGSPVLKLMVLNWLDGAEGVRWVSEWAPVPSSDGDFGSVVVVLRRR